MLHEKLLEFPTCKKSYVVLCDTEWSNIDANAWVLCLILRQLAPSLSQIVGEFCAALRSESHTKR